MWKVGTAPHTNTFGLVIKAGTEPTYGPTLASTRSKPSVRKKLLFILPSSRLRSWRTRLERDAPRRRGARPIRRIRHHSHCSAFDGAICQNYGDRPGLLRRYHTALFQRHLQCDCRAYLLEARVTLARFACARHHVSWAAGGTILSNDAAVFAAHEAVK